LAGCAKGPVFPPSEVSRTPLGSWNKCPSMSAGHLGGPVPLGTGLMDVAWFPMPKVEGFMGVAAVLEH